MMRAILPGLAYAQLKVNEAGRQEGEPEEGHGKAQSGQCQKVTATAAGSRVQRRSVAALSAI